MPEDNMKKTKINKFLRRARDRKINPSRRTFLPNEKSRTICGVNRRVPKGIIMGRKRQWIKRPTIHNSQSNIENISRLYGKVDYIIIDSPILNGLVYKTQVR